VIYGKTQIANPEAKATYQEKAKGMQNAYNVAVADFLHAPSIDEIDLTKYKGKVGDSIRVRVMDDFKVAEVQLTIYNSDGSLVEQGPALQQGNVLDWIYTAQAENATLTGDKIVVRASDKPGNIAQQEQLL
jgi:hypothetical protein